MLFRAVLIMLALTGAALAQDAAFAFREARGFARKVQADKAKRPLRHYWQRAIERLENVVEKHPHSPQAAEAQYLIGDLYLDMSTVSLIDDDVRSAVAAYRDVVTKFPSSRQADDAQFAIGEINRDRLHDRTGIPRSRWCLLDSLRMNFI